MSIHVHLERFEGPLGLLLHLIREQEMDIFNININQITRQYLEYIRTMRRLDLEVAGEFIAMAATLIHIKSRMLLPQYDEEGQEIHEDPRKELVQKLLEYKKIKEVSVDLYKQPLLNRDVFARGFRTDVESLEEGELVLEEKPLFSLIAAFRHAMKNMKKTWHRVLGEVQSISVRILEIKDLLVVGKRILFNDLITDRSREAGQVLVTFLSLLELAKMGFVSLFQAAPFADMHIETKRPIDRDVITQVESYDAVNAEQKAAEIFNEAQLSLDESVMEPEGAPDPEKPVVEETFADAATDEEIAAEEIALFGENTVEALAEIEMPVTDETVTELAAAPEPAPVVEMPAPGAEESKNERVSDAISNAAADFAFLTAAEEPPRDVET
jgi:segregation and condensation protein A